MAFFGIVEHVNYDMSAVTFRNSTHEQRVICPDGESVVVSMNFTSREWIRPNSNLSWAEADIRVTVPHVKIEVGSWELELLAKIREGRKLHHIKKFASLRTVFLAFLNRCPRHVCQDPELLTSNFDLCTGAPST